VLVQAHTSCQLRARGGTCRPPPHSTSPPAARPLRAAALTPALVVRHRPPCPSPRRSQRCAHTQESTPAVRRRRRHHETPTAPPPSRTPPTDSRRRLSSRVGASSRARCCWPCGACHDPGPGSEPRQWICPKFGRSFKEGCCGCQRDAGGAPGGALVHIGTCLRAILAPVEEL
jgi:hypothetical protein